MDSDWQIRIKNNIEASLYMYEKSLYTDCTFIIGQGKIKSEFKAHKHVLVGASPVFERMFYSDVTQNVNEIEITDIDPSVFEKFLLSIYSGKPNFTTFRDVCDLFYAANKYMVQRIADPCLTFILDNINYSNASEAYELLDLFGFNEEAEDCKKIIFTRTSNVIGSESFVDIQKNTLFMILNEDQLAVNSEIELYYATVRWIEAEVQRKGVADDEKNNEDLRTALYSEIMPSIRFLSMSGSEFAGGPGINPHISKDVLFPLLLKIIKPDASVNLPPAYSTNKRLILPNITLPFDASAKLLYAANAGDIKTLKELQSQGVNLKESESILHMTARKGYLEATRWLLRQGLDPNSEAPEELYCYNLDSANQLVNQLVIDDSYNSDYELGIHDCSYSHLMYSSTIACNSKSVLHAALSSGKRDVVALILEYGGNP